MGPYQAGGCAGGGQVGTGGTGARNRCPRSAESGHDLRSMLDQHPGNPAADEATRTEYQDSAPLVRGSPRGVHGGGGTVSALASSSSAVIGPAVMENSPWVTDGPRTTKKRRPG